MKKCFSILMSVVLISTLALPCSANAYDSQNLDAHTFAETEIQETLATVMEDVYRQLEEQDALVLLDTYEQILTAEIESSILAKYGLTSASRASLNMPNGGVVTYLSPVADYEPTEVYSVYLERQRTLDYILNMYSFHIEDIIIEILGFIPFVDDITSHILDISSYADRAAITSINAAGGYTHIINTYSREFGTSASVVTGWDAHPVVTTPNNAMEVQYRLFPAYTE